MCVGVIEGMLDSVWGGVCGGGGWEVEDVGVCVVHVGVYSVVCVCECVCRGIHLTIPYSEESH